MDLLPSGSFCGIDVFVDGIGRHVMCLFRAYGSDPRFDFPSCVKYTLSETCPWHGPKAITNNGTHAFSPQMHKGFDKSSGKFFRVLRSRFTRLHSVFL